MFGWIERKAKIILHSGVCLIWTQTKRGKLSLTRQEGFSKASRTGFTRQLFLALTS